MRINIKKTKTIPQLIEDASCSRLLVCIVLCLLLGGLIKIDSTLLRVLRQSYASGFGLVGAYMREEPSRISSSVGSEIRMVTISGT
ncbi:MAG TPA: hypothetical protein VGS08_03645 [Candidatus Saccharimonadales bacterium]|nr:hypothetical protein [Candidatus Saccharimonadales bacterium]